MNVEIESPGEKKGIDLGRGSGSVRVKRLKKNVTDLLLTMPYILI